MSRVFVPGCTRIRQTLGGKAYRVGLATIANTKAWMRAHENGTGAVIESYVQWVNPPRSHEALMADALAEAENDPHEAFDRLYQSMNALRRFGRTARFDYLTMIGKLGLANIEPGTAYLSGSTGPLKGAQLLFGVGSRATLEVLTAQLGNQLGVGMQVMEDALCNWQKSPGIFKPFRG